MAQQVKKLDVAGMKALRDLEEELQCCIVALEPQPTPSTTLPAQLSVADIKQLQAAEKAMEAILVAYKC